jgi:hypothetical protein
MVESFLRFTTYCAVSLKTTDMPEGMEAVIDMDWLTGGVVYTTLALPEASVTIGLPENAPLTPPSSNVTATPGTGFPYWSVTWTTSGTGRVEPAVTV